jgi:hypothetical protein
VAPSRSVVRANLLALRGVITASRSPNGYAPAVREEREFRVLAHCLIGFHAHQIKVSVELELPRHLESRLAEDRRARPPEMPGSNGTIVETIHELIHRYPKSAYELGLFFQSLIPFFFHDQ